MRKIKYFIYLLFALSIVGCSEKADNIDDNDNDNLLYLSMFSSLSYPEEDIWVISDETATSSDFAGLSDALIQLSTTDSDRKITLEFPNLTSIPDYAMAGGNSDDYFYNTSIRVLNSISAPKATAIGNSAFSYCSTLTTINIPLVTDIGSTSFYDCSALTSIEMPLVTTIKYAAFYCCTSLTSLEIPLVITIEESVFGNCRALISIEIPSTTSIGHNTFADCTSLTTMYLATNNNVVLEYIGSNVFTTSEDIDLTIGATNIDYISENTLTIGDYSYTFKPITLK